MRMKKINENIFIDEDLIIIDNLTIQQLSKICLSLNIEYKRIVIYEGKAYFYSAYYVEQDLKLYTKNYYKKVKS